MNHSLIHSFNDIYDEMGNDFLDSFFIPAFKSGFTKTLEITHLDIITKFSKYKDEQKINNFIFAAKKLGFLKKLEDINSFNQSQKYFLLESLRKTLCLNDFIQISLVTYLVDEYSNNSNTLKYWQKSLYYNIENLTEDDFIIFDTIMKDSEEQKNSHDENDVFYILQSRDNNEEIVKDKFINMGILLSDSNRMYGQNINFKKSEVSEIFHEVLTRILELDLKNKNQS